MNGIEFETGYDEVSFCEEDIDLGDGRSLYVEGNIGYRLEMCEGGDEGERWLAPANVTLGTMELIAWDDEKDEAIEITNVDEAIKGFKCCLSHERWN